MPLVSSFPVRKSFSISKLSAVVFTIHAASALTRTFGKTRSAFIASLLADAQKRERELLAAEGYRFFSSEAEEFAAASESAAAEAMDDEYR